MTARWRTQDLGADGVFESLQLLDARGHAENWLALAQELDAAGIPGVWDAITYLMQSGLAAEDLTGRLLLTQPGRRTHLLMCALNATRSFEDLVRFLSSDVPSMPRYQLVTRMTEEFIVGLHDRPDFRRIYICSPWISFSARQLQYLMHAVALASRAGDVEIEVLTRATQNAEGVNALRDLGAHITFRNDLHTKLYIREPGPAGGLELGILGSQNLTRSEYEELGIAVRNDSVITNNLISYFFALAYSRMA